jgi:hypothetical protein
MFYGWNCLYACVTTLSCGCGNLIFAVMLAIAVMEQYVSHGDVLVSYYHLKLQTYSSYLFCVQNSDRVEGGYRSQMFVQCSKELTYAVQQKFTRVSATCYSPNILPIKYVVWLASHKQQVEGETLGSMCPALRSSAQRANATHADDMKTDSVMWFLKTCHFTISFEFTAFQCDSKKQ